jgi:formylmethanofuran dehydrogenase subunit B
MKITELKEFDFYIGNTTDDEGEMLADVEATNEGIEVDGELVATYDETIDINNADDLMEVIDDAISSAESIKQEDRDELGTYLGAEIDINAWWKINYEL